MSSGCQFQLSYRAPCPPPLSCARYLSTQVLHLLAMEGPNSKEPSKYIRYIYNRVILENATVRAAAVSALANFGAQCEELRPRVDMLLRRALYDNDDEVLTQPALVPWLHLRHECVFVLLWHFHVVRLLVGSWAYRCTSFPVNETLQCR